MPMEIIELIKRPDIANNAKLSRRYLQYEILLHEISKKSIPDTIAEFINQNISGLNSIDNNSDKKLQKQLRTSQSKILKLLEKELKMVTLNHYRNAWMAIGLSMGIAIGSAIGSTNNNMSLLSVGLTIGMLLGIVYGKNLDKKSNENNLQLNIEIKY